MSSGALIIGFWTILFISNALLKVRFEKRLTQHYALRFRQWATGIHAAALQIEHVDFERAMCEYHQMV